MKSLTFVLMLLMIPAFIKSLNLSSTLRNMYFKVDSCVLRRVFGLLDFEKPGTRLALIRLLSQDEYPLRDDYERLIINREQAKSLVENFISAPDLHPMVLSFTLYARNNHIQDALEPLLSSYRPDNYLISRQKTCGLKCDHLPIILNSTSDKNLGFWSEPLITAAKVCGWIPLPWEIDYELWQQVDLPTMIMNYGQVPTLLELLYHHDLETLQPALRAWIKNGGECSAFMKSLLDFSKSNENWEYNYQKLLESVQNFTSNLDESRQALWHAKLIIGLLQSVITGKLSFLRDAKGEIGVMVEFLKAHNLKDVPKFLLSKLLSYPLYIPPNYYPQLCEKLKAIDRIFPQGPKIWGGKIAHIKLWRSKLRSLGRWNISAPECDPCTFTEIENWWGNDNESLSRMLFMDPDSFPIIRLKSKHGVTIRCQGITSFLLELSKMYHKESRMFQRSNSEGALYIVHGSRSVTMVRSLARTLACNVLYRFELGFDLGGPQAILKLYNCDCTGAAVLVSRILKDADLFTIPAFLLI